MEERAGRVVRGGLESEGTRELAELLVAQGVEFETMAIN